MQFAAWYFNVKTSTVNIAKLRNFVQWAATAWMA